MTDTAVELNLSLSKISDNPGTSEICNCVKVEKQLQQLLEELSSAHLIIQMLEKELRTVDATPRSNQHEDCERYTARDWEVKLKQGNEGNLEGKRKIKRSEGIGEKTDTIEIYNRFSILVMDEDIQTNKIKVPNSENLSRLVSSALETQTKQNTCMQIDSKSSQRNPQDNEKNLHNLQSESASPQQMIIKGRDKNYKVPTVINGRVAEETPEMLWGKRSPIPWERVPKISGQNAKQIYTHINILLLGDSHIKGLAERMSISLGNSFRVSGFSKPNANIKEIISPSNSSYVNLTKQDMIIFCGGTRDISRNDSKSGLHTLLEFAKRTSATNVILLEAPIRYDLPPSSYVSTQK